MLTLADLQDIKSLLDRLRDAYGKMSAENEHRAVLSDAAQCLVSLAQRLADLQKAAEKDERRIVLPGE